MPLEHLRIRNLRCFTAIDLDLVPGVNLFVGDNGSGKTSLLESPYLLSRGSTFRTSTGRQLIRDGCEDFTVIARMPADGPVRRLALNRSRELTRARINETPCQSLTEIMRAFPALILEPGSHRLLEDGPANRRKLLDWVVFHVEHSYLDCWRDYARTLRQRNQVLRRGDTSSLSVWSQALVEKSEIVDRMRSAVAEKLAAELISIAADLLGDIGEPELRYRRGWPDGEALGEVLERQLATDRDRGFTHAGPHRAELVLKLGGGSAREFLSRGQQKLLLWALTLAQARVIHAATELMPLVMVDDWAAELGPAARGLLWDSVSRFGGQVLLTALEPDARFAGLDSARMFHVKHSSVTPML